MIYKYSLAICFALLLTIPSAHAHHAWSAVFTEELMSIEGYVTEFTFKNPHVNIMLSVTDEAGVETEWMATGPAASPFRNWGWSQDTVEVGQYLRLIGRTSRTGAPMIVMVADDIRGGNLLELDPTDGSIIRKVVGTVVERNSAPASVASIPLTLNDGRVNLTGTWLGGGRGAIVPTPFNEVGAALQASFDPLTDDPAFATCSPDGLVRQVRTGRSVVITQYNDRVVFEYEEHGLRREIFLDNRGPETSELSLFGHPVARYEGDELIIESSQILAHLADLRGNALSDQTTTIERYRRVDDPEAGPMLEMSIAISDPGHLSEVWNLGWRKSLAQAGDPEALPWGCQLPLPGAP